MSELEKSVPFSWYEWVPVVGAGSVALNGIAYAKNPDSFHKGVIPHLVNKMVQGKRHDMEMCLLALAGNLVYHGHVLYNTAAAYQAFSQM